MDFDYNTVRGKLILPEYGRNIQRMVEHTVGLEDIEERNRAARTIIAIMGNMNPHLRDVADFKHKLWDHLAIMSDFRLDIDYPYEIPTKKALETKPNRVDYNQHNIPFKHYGKIIQLMLQRAAEFPEGEHKTLLITALANHMKKLYLTWNRESVTDEAIFGDVAALTKGHITLNEEVKLSESRDILSKNKKSRLKKLK